MRALIDHGTDVNVADRDGDTALHIAAGTNSPEAIDFFVEAGANVNARNRFGLGTKRQGLARPLDQGC